MMLTHEIIKCLPVFGPNGGQRKTIRDVHGARRGDVLGKNDIHPPFDQAVEQIDSKLA